MVRLSLSCPGERDLTELALPARLLGGAGAGRLSSRLTLQYTGTHISPTEMA
ncbi:hypothetical protein ACGF5O_39600 [Streptomyces sp. NPDC048291]|uniref:hypothetical protein n=1 Tax=Streptomyces sp. NPDC048291 TaxID=3365530 RepID=UPI00372091D1